MWCLSCPRPQWVQRWSTFKPVSETAALTSGMSPRDTFFRISFHGVLACTRTLSLSRARTRSPSLFLFSSTICVSGLKFKLNLLLVYVSTQAFKLALEKHKTHESCSSNWRMDTTCELPLVAMVIWPGDLLLDWLTHELCALNLNSILDLNLY